RRDAGDVFVHGAVVERIDPSRVGPAAGRRDRSCHGLYLRARTAGEEDLGALGGELACDRCADRPGGPEDDGPLSFEKSYAAHSVLHALAPSPSKDGRPGSKSTFGAGTGADCRVREASTVLWRRGGPDSRRVTAAEEEEPVPKFICPNLDLQNGTMEVRVVEVSSPAGS